MADDRKMQQSADAYASTNKLILSYPFLKTNKLILSYLRNANFTSVVTDVVLLLNLLNQRYFLDNSDISLRNILVKKTYKNGLVNELMGKKSTKRIFDDETLINDFLIVKAIKPKNIVGAQHRKSVPIRMAILLAMEIFCL
uniref:Uncharacterized protein n=1 Tax=Romanomermis culicivorax TaxID=13658 RepID=A0A915J802_ROMCU